MVPQSIEGQYFLKKNQQMLPKNGSQTPTKFLYVVIRIQR